MFDRAKLDLIRCSIRSLKFVIPAIAVCFVGICHGQQLPTTVSIQGGAWNDAATWSNGIPDSNLRAIVSNGMTVLLDGADHEAGELVIQGTLLVLESPGVDKSLTSKWIHVNSGGIFQAGSAVNRYDANQFVVTLTGDDPNEVFIVEGVANPISNNNGFLMAAGGGRFQFFGEEKLSFTKLAATAEIGTNFIIVEKQIDRNFDGQITGADGTISWKTGDEIVIASSSQDYADEEVRNITSIADPGDGTLVMTLNQPVLRRHYGVIETYQNSDRQYDIDMRAEVAVLNRSIKIQGEAHHDTDNVFGDRVRFNMGTGDGFGGHTMIMASAGQTTIDNVQFDQMGQTGRLGRYPVHWHIGKDRTGDVLRGASITNSNNRGVTIHATDNVVIQDVVLHDIHGHGFFMENGVETGNIFAANIAFGIHKVGRSAAVGDFAPDLNDPFIVDTHDHVGQNPNRFLSSSAYWITNPDNFWQGNISAGSEGTGYWFILPDFAIGDSSNDPDYANSRANRTNLRQFDHNSSHSSPIGFNMDRGPDIEVPVGAELASPFFGRRYLPPSEPQFDHYTAYQHNVGVYQRGDIANFFENRFADNFTCTFITFTQRITNTLYVGHSRGNSDPNQVVTGHSLYDGANRLTGTHFAGFAAANAHNFRPHGSALRHTSHLFNDTSFEDDGSGLTMSISTQNGGSNHNSAFQSSASAVYDQDGTLTGPSGGGPGLTVVSNHPFFYDSGDVRPAGWNAWLSDDTYSVVNILPVNLNADFRFTSPDGDTDTWTNSIGQFGFNTHVKNDAGDYVIEVPQGAASVEQGLKLMHYTRVGPSGATVIRFEGIGLTLAPDLNELSNLTSLRNSSSSAYYRDGDDLWLKLYSSSQRIDFDPTTINENDPPVAVDDLASTTSGVPVTIDLLANDFDPNGDLLAVIPIGTLASKYSDDFQSPNPPPNWEYLWNATGEFGNESSYQGLVWDTWRYRPTTENFPYFTPVAAHPGSGTNQDPNGIERFAIAAYTVPEDGVYAIDASFVSVNENTLDGINVQAHVSGGPVFTLEDLFLTNGDFDGTIGFLPAGEKIYLGVGSNTTAGADGTNWDFSIIRASDSANGSLRFEPDGTVEFSPDNAFFGTETFSYQISDGRGGRDSALVSIDVGGDVAAEEIQVLAGNIASGGLPEVEFSDDSYLKVFAVPAQPFFETGVEVEFSASVTDLSPDSLIFAFESRVSTTNIIQQIAVYNYETQLFQNVDSRAASTSDETIEILLSGNLEDLVDQATGEIRTKVSWIVIGPVTGFPWSLHVDRVAWKLNAP